MSSVISNALIYRKWKEILIYQKDWMIVLYVIYRPIKLKNKLSYQIGSIVLSHRILTLGNNFFPLV